MPVTSDKFPPSEGLRSVLWLLFQLCLLAASAVQPPLQNVCDFEGLFGSSVANPASGDIPTTPFQLN